MLFGRLGSRALMGAAVAVGIGAGSGGGFVVPASQAASLGAPAAARDSAVVLIQASPQASPCGTASGPPCKEKKADAKPKKEKLRKMSTCGPGLAPCPGSSK